MAGRKRVGLKILGGLFGLILVLVVAVLVVPGFIDWSAYRGRIAGAIEGATGRQAAIGGNIAFAVLPRPRLMVEEFALANAPQGADQPMIDLERLDVEVALWPLLSGEIAVQRLVLQSPRILIETYADGSTNLTFGPDDPAAEPAAGPDIALNQMAIRDGTVIYRTPEAEQRVDGVDLEIAAPSVNGPFSVAGAVRLNGVPVDVSLEASRLDAQPMPLELRARLAEAASLRFDGGLVPDTGAVNGRLALTAESAAQFAAAASQAAGADAAELPGLDQPLSLGLRLDGADGRYRITELDGQLGQARLTGSPATQTAPRMAISADLTLAGLVVDPFLAATGEAPAPSPSEPAPFSVPDIGLDVDLQITDLTYQGDRLGPIWLAVRDEPGAIVLETAQAALPGASLNLSGRVTARSGQPHFAGPLTVAVRDIEALAALADMAPEQLPPAVRGDIDFSAQLAGTAEQVRLSLIILALPQTSIRGSAALAPARPRIEADLRTDALDLDSFTAPASETSQASSSASGFSGWSREPVDLSALTAFDAAIAVKARRVVSRGLTLSDAVLRLAVQDGVARIEDLSGQTFGGRIKVSGSADTRAARPRMALDLELENAQLAAMAAQFLDPGLLSGSASLTGAFTTEGVSLHDWMNALAGTLQLQAKDGTIRGFDIPRLVNQLRAVNDPGGIAGLLTTSLDGGQTRFLDFAATAQARNGRLLFNDIAGRLAGADLAGQGGVNLVNLGLAAQGRLTLTELANAPAMPFTLDGTLVQPQFSIDPVALQQFLVQRLTQGTFDQLLGTIFGGSAPGAQQSPTPANPQTERPEDVVRGLFGTILDQARRAEQENKKKQDPPR